MKVVNEKAVYVQKKDIEFFIKHNIDMPAFILGPLLAESPLKIDDSNKFDFVEYTDDLSMEFFKKMDWILDYNDVKDSSPSEIMEEMINLVLQLDQLGKKIQKMTEEDKQIRPSEMEEYILLDHYYNGFLDFIGYLNGIHNFEIPGKPQL